jgi:hypothetical protein
MGETAMPQGLDDLEPFIGRWHMTPSFADAPQARTTFAWLAERRFLIQRWEVDHPDAPDGIAVVGGDSATGAYVQHYFDSRGIARLYGMGFADDVWTLQRMAEHPDFSQRCTGRFVEGGNSIVGRWESSNDQGSSWASDFELTYTGVE